MKPDIKQPPKTSYVFDLAAEIDSTPPFQDLSVADPRKAARDMLDRFKRAKEREAFGEYDSIEEGS